MAVYRVIGQKKLQCQLTGSTHGFGVGMDHHTLFHDAVAGGEQGTVRSISLVYTVLTTIDNRRVSVPNGTLMNSTISNASVEPLRRVDINFDIAGSEDADKVEKILNDVIAKSGKALKEPASQALITGAVPGGLTYTVRVWVKTDDYWDEYGYLMKEIPSALNAAKIARPSTPISVNK